MMPFLLLLWKFKTAIGAALLVIVIGYMALRIGSLNNQVEKKQIEVARITEERDRVKNERDLALEVAKRNADAAAAAQRERQEIVALLDAERARQNERNESVQSIIKEVKSAKPASHPASDGLAAAHRGVQRLIKNQAAAK